MRIHRRHLAVPLFAIVGAIAACSSTKRGAGPDLATQLEQDTGTRWTVYVDPKSQEVRFLAPETPVAFGSGTPEEKARAFFDRYRAALHASGKPDELTLAGTAADPRGGIHVRFEHTLPGTGLPIFHAGTTAHFTSDGSLYWVAPDFRADVETLDPTATLAKADAVQAAMGQLASVCGASGPAPTADVAELGVLWALEAPSALVYRIPVPTQSATCIAPLVFVDAKRGTLVEVEETAPSVLSPMVPGARFYRANETKDKKQFDMLSLGPSEAPAYTMVGTNEDGSRVFTRSFGEALPFTTNDPAVWDADPRVPGDPPPVPGAAVDAHHHALQAMKYLRTFTAKFQGHGRYTTPPLSVDLDVIVHDETQPDNASAAFDAVTGHDKMTIGDGDLSVPNQVSLAAAYDAVAHELTHNITRDTSALVYGGEPGALDESFSDVMGASAEHAVAPNDAKNFLMSEDAYVGLPLGRIARSLIDPQSLGSPDHIDDETRCPGADLLKAYDHCSVHTNSGIPNRVFSLMVVGGRLTKKVDGGPPQVRPIGVPSGMGWASATEATFWAMTGLQPTAMFPVAALAHVVETERAAPASWQITACAWLAVGVYTPRSDIEATLLAAYCKPPSDAPSPPSPTTVGSNVCSGHGDAFVCDPSAPSQAIGCTNGAPTIPASTLYCADNTQACQPVSASDPTAVTDQGALQCE